MSFSISNEDIANFRADYNSRRDSRVLERTVTKNGVRNASFDWHSIADDTPHFSIDLKTGDVADQKQSGRCWMFAALNTMRHEMQQKFNLPDNFDNESNEGEIFFQLINFGLKDYHIKKGERIGQGIFLPYLLADEETAPQAQRTGGFGSTKK